MSSHKKLQSELKKLANPEKAIVLQRFFKTGKGQYGEGDIFLGVMVPEQRKLIKSFCDLKLSEIAKLFSSKIHEERLCAALLLVKKYQLEKDSEKQTAIYNFYIANAKSMNNWDLVDLSAPHIVGHFLLDKNKNILHTFAKSTNLWERRIAIISTFYFIKNNQFKETFKIAIKLINDEEDLIHKATGWMLREISKRNFTEMEEFLKLHYTKMPRTMLRYAIEKFPETKRQYYLRKN
jgi:3-methyladenine DNA glycosylase AlkD